ncbi:AAA family ATPase [Nocardia sp. NPDC051832]|uniref:MinD/ParA family ATP-binding protein n=1 Tax=Nocardia sp. NPDC051832 TaxID=3155673 RepID=UPI0034441665
MSRNNDSLPMLPPWLAESDGGGSGYEEPVQNLPHEDLIDDSPRRKEKKKRKGLFGRDKDNAAEPASERGSDSSWGQPQQPAPDLRSAARPQHPDTGPGSRPQQPGSDAGPGSWSQPQPDAWGQQPPGRPMPPQPRPEDSRPSGPQSRETAPPPGLPTRQPGEHRGSFQPLGQTPDTPGGAPEPMPSSEATTRYTRPEPEAPAAERPPLPESPARLPEPPARLPEPPARLPEPPVDRPYLPGSPTGEQPSTPETRSRDFDGPPTGARPDLPGPPPGSDSAPPVSSGRPPLPDPPPATGEPRGDLDGPPPWLAGPSDPGHLGLDPEEPQADPAQSGSGPIPRGRHWLPSDHKDNAQPSEPAAESQPEQPWNPPPFTPPAEPTPPGEQRGPDGRRIPGAFAPPAAGSRAPVSDQPAPGERRDPGVFNQPPSRPGDPNPFAPAASGQPAPGERRDPGLYNQPGSGQSSDPSFAPGSRRAPGGEPAPGERRDPGLYNQSQGQPVTGQPSDPNLSAPAAIGQPAPGERRDPGLYDQPGSGQLGDPSSFAPGGQRATVGDPMSGERRDPGLYNQPPSRSTAGQPSDANAFAPPASAQRAPVGDQPAPGERRDPGVFNQPPGQPSDATGERRDPGRYEQSGDANAFAAPASGQRASVGDPAGPGERRDPGLYNQPGSGQPTDFAPPGSGQRAPSGDQVGANPPFTGQANPYAPPASGQRAPAGDQPAPGERRDPGVFNQPPSQPFNAQPGQSAYAPPVGGQRAPAGDQPAPGERRDPGVFNQPNPPFNGQPGPGGQAPSGYAPGGPGQGAGPQPSGWDQPQAPQQGGQWSNGPRPNHGGPPPSLDDVPLRRAKKAPGGGWRKAVHHMSGGAINPGMSAEELRLQELVARIRQPVRGDYRIAVLSLKGGVGKTTTTMGLGSIFASIRGDRVIAVDANPDFGTLSQRVPLQTRSTVRDLLLDPNVERYSDVRKHTSQATSRLEVLASERDPAASEQFDEHEYRAVARILQRYYNIILTDCGTGLTHSAMSGVLDLAHSLVLISSAAIDGARSAAATLDWLSLHGHDHLVRNAVVVINLPREGSVNVGIQQLREYFLSRCRAVHIIPFDDHLSEGAEIDLHRLSKHAKRAYVELAATVADEFNLDHRRYH